MDRGFLRSLLLSGGSNGWRLGTGSFLCRPRLFALGGGRGQWRWRRTGFVDVCWPFDPCCWVSRGLAVVLPVCVLGVCSLVQWIQLGIKMFSLLSAVT